jgi:hypothetical protein
LVVVVAGAVDAGEDSVAETAWPSVLETSASLASSFALSLTNAVRSFRNFSRLRFMLAEE